MTFEELILGAKQHGCALVPIPERVDHEFKVNDYVEEIISVRRGHTRLANEVLQPRRGRVVAYASTADLIIRSDTGHYWVYIARPAGSRLRKLTEVQNERPANNS